MEKIDPADLEFKQLVRCYNGAFDSDSQEILDKRERVLEKIRELEPEAHVTYFPGEEKYVVHVYGRELSTYAPSEAAALADAYNRLFS